MVKKKAPVKSSLYVSCHCISVCSHQHQWIAEILQKWHCTCTGHTCPIRSWLHSSINKSSWIPWTNIITNNMALSWSSPSRVMVIQICCPNYLVHTSPLSFHLILHSSDLMIASYSEIKMFCYAFVDYCNHLPTGILKEMHVYASITTNYSSEWLHQSLWRSWKSTLHHKE
jgi:hypothetical protein